MKEVFPEKKSNKERKDGLHVGNGSGVAALNRMNHVTLVAGQILDEAGGVGSSTTWLPDMGVMTKRFSAVVKTQKRWSNKIYKSELTEIKI